MTTKRVALIFGAAKQNIAAEHLALAELEAAENVEMDKLGTYVKRPGFSRAAPTVDSGSWTSGAGGSAFDGVAPGILDGADRCWTYDVDNGVLRNRGRYQRGYARVRTYAPPSASGGAYQATPVEAGLNTWVFVRRSSGIEFHIVNTATGAVVQGPTTVTTSVVTSFAAVSDGTNIWVLWVAGGTTITSEKLVIATPTVAAVSTTYSTTAGAAWLTVDAFRFTAFNEIAVVAQAITGATYKRHQSYLDTATRAAKAAPAAVVTSHATSADFVIPAGGAQVRSSISILNGSNGSATWFYVCWDENLCKLVEVNATTLADTATTNLETFTSTGLVDFRGTASGYHDGTNWVVFHSAGQTRATVEYPNLKRTTKNGGGSTTVTSNRNLWVVGRPAQVGTTWCVPLSYERYASTDASALLQRTWYLASADGQLLARALPGQLRAETVGDTGQPSTPNAIVDLTNGIFTTATVCDVTTPLTITSSQPHNSALIRVGLSESFGRPAKYAKGKLCVPGSIPGRFGAYDRAHELTPLLFPAGVTAALGSGSALAGATGVAVVYRLSDADGMISRSSPSVTASFTFTNAGTRSITVDTLRVGHFADQFAGLADHLTRAKIEIYVTDVGTSTLRLLTVLNNSVTAATITHVFNPSAPDYCSAEILYTTGGRVSNAVAPQAHAAAFWRDRLHLASDDFVFSSDESTFGFAPAFSEFKRRRFQGGESRGNTGLVEGAGDIVALEPLDQNYLGAWKEGAIAVLFGQGPDGRGAGNYDLSVLRSRRGVFFPRAIVQAEAGVFWQDGQDGAICVLTPELQVQVVDDGVFSRRASPVFDALYVPELDQVWFAHGSAGRMLVLDHGHPTKDQPYGRWVEWTSSGMVATPPQQMFSDPTGPAWLDAAGTVRRRETAVYTDATSGAAAAYTELMRTGEFPFAGWGAEYDIMEATAVLENLAGVTLNVQLSLTSDRAEKSKAKTFSLATTRRRAWFKPGEQTRVSATKVAVDDLASQTAGFRLVAVILEIAAEQHGKFPRTGDRS